MSDGSSVLMMVVVYGCIQNAWTSVMVTMFAVSVKLLFVKSTAEFHYYILFFLNTSDKSLASWLLIAVHVQLRDACMGNYYNLVN